MENEEELDDYDLVLLSKTFKRFFNKNSMQEKEKLAQKAFNLMCFKCIKPSQADCPPLNIDKFQEKKHDNLCNM